jgi:L-lactate dehydrogenase complex protein LldG
MVGEPEVRRVSAREQMLGAIRDALRDVPVDEPPAWDPSTDPDPAAAYARGRSTGGAGDPADRVDRFAERCGEYRATVTRCGTAPDAVAAAVAAVCERREATALVVAPGLEPRWIPDSIGPRIDEPRLSMAELDGCDGVLTTCALAIAETGTIVLDAGPGQGRRALTLIPDLHICVVTASAIVSSVPEAFALLGPVDGGPRSPITLISGPSATSDIELERVEGVHGPRRLEVIVTGER